MRVPGARATFLGMRGEPLPLGVLLWVVPWQVYTLATPAR
jgi:hypothetical protein